MSAVRAGYARVSEALTSAKAQRRQRRIGRLKDEGGRQREESEHDCGGECVALEYRECRVARGPGCTVMNEARLMTIGRDDRRGLLFPVYGLTYLPFNDHRPSRSRTAAGSLDSCPRAAHFANS